ncbi:MAG: hypothetical protein IIC04_04905 [Proteobacteria bacterium]|nr:hypothetical protein [Pseudomonadota bacterium]
MNVSWAGAGDAASKAEAMTMMPKAIPGLRPPGKPRPPGAFAMGLA